MLSSPYKEAGAVRVGVPALPPSCSPQGQGLGNKEPRHRGLPSPALFNSVGVPYEKGFRSAEEEEEEEPPVMAAWAGEVV